MYEIYALYNIASSYSFSVFYLFFSKIKETDGLCEGAQLMESHNSYILYEECMNLDTLVFSRFWYFLTFIRVSFHEQVFKMFFETRTCSYVDCQISSSLKMLQIPRVAYFVAGYKICTNTFLYEYLWMFYILH